MAMAWQRNSGGHRRTRAGGSRRGDERSKNHPPPYGNGLLIRLIAHPSFLEAVSMQDAPAIVADESQSIQQGSQLRLVDWARLEDLLRWFAKGCARDETANMIFNESLHQHHRSQIHRLADQVGLDSFSQGFGRRRLCSLYAKGKAPAKALINDVTQKQAKLLYLLAKSANLPASRDECAEMLAEQSLTPELKELWETEGKEQLEIVRLNQCASRGLVDELKVAIDANPELVRSGKAEVASTLTPLNCAAAQGHVDCLEALLDAGAPIEAMDGFGQTALQASRRFEQMDTEAVLIRAGAEDPPEREDSVTSQSDLAELIRALPRGHKESPAVERLADIAESEGQEGFNRAVRSSFENLSQIPMEEKAQEEEPPKSPYDTNAEPEVEFNSLAKVSAQSQSQKQRQGAMPRVPSGLVNPLTGAMVYGQAISRRYTGDMPLNSSINMDMRREYEGSPDLRDPKAATRGSRGAAAMALGRRIMQNASNLEARRQQSARIPEADDTAARNAVVEENQDSVAVKPPAAEGGKTLQNIFNPQGQPLSLTSARMNVRFGHGKQTSKQRINAWMESAPEEHSSDSSLKLTHSVSNPQFGVNHELSGARADSAPEQDLVLGADEIVGQEDFDIKDHTTYDLYNEIDAMGSRPATEKNVRRLPSEELPPKSVDAEAASNPD